ncbi:STAS domain-containing protein [Actinomadura kijaniata]|uniref:Anti-sigma factor antagonist n=1 Tax=Actinomadura namibiensis TaxID=182080 RepID=A0A7W3LQT8_ACTNM|nr:STAS domain-containing protein [Actinomadura namibiensis]MBA8952580.1 anti-anti-sigma factor [Actinomadura namibiensis]
MSPLDITRRDTATGPVLHVAGDLDYTHAPGFRDRVQQLTLTAGQCLVLDLSGLEFCDSSGITALLAARQHVRAADAVIILAAVPSNLMRTLTLVGLDQVFTIVPSADKP